MKGEQGKAKKWTGKSKRSKIVTIIDEQESSQEQPLVQVRRQVEDKQPRSSHKGRGRAGIQFHRAHGFDNGDVFDAEAGRKFIYQDLKRPK